MAIKATGESPGGLVGLGPTPPIHTEATTASSKEVAFNLAWDQQPSPCVGWVASHSGKRAACLCDLPLQQQQQQASVLASWARAVQATSK